MYVGVTGVCGVMGVWGWRVWWWVTGVCGGDRCVWGDGCVGVMGMVVG